MAHLSPESENKLLRWLLALGIGVLISFVSSAVTASSYDDRITTVERRVSVLESHLGDIDEALARIERNTAQISGVLMQAADRSRP